MISYITQSFYKGGACCGGGGGGGGGSYYSQPIQYEYAPQECDPCKLRFPNIFPSSLSFSSLRLNIDHCIAVSDILSTGLLEILKKSFECVIQYTPYGDAWEFYKDIIEAAESNQQNGVVDGN